MQHLLARVDQTAHWAPRPRTRALDAATTDSDLAAVGAPNQRAVMPAPTLHGPYVAPLVQHAGDVVPGFGRVSASSGGLIPPWVIASPDPCGTLDRTVPPSVPQGSHERRKPCGDQ